MAGISRVSLATLTLVDADRLRRSWALLRQHLTGPAFAATSESGAQLDDSQVIGFALDAITRATAKT